MCAFLRSGVPVSNYELRPFVGTVARRPTLVPHDAEVAAIVELPLEVLFGPDASRSAAWVAFTALLLALLPRRFAADRFRQADAGVVLHPVAILLLLAVQWYALARAALGRPVGWKGRGAPEASGRLTRPARSR